MGELWPYLCPKPWGKACHDEEKRRGADDVHRLRALSTDITIGSEKRTTQWMNEWLPSEMKDGFY